MYHTMSIDQLSKKQVSKLLNGHPVRVKMGSGGKIHVTSEQAKKMNRAGLKGCAITLTLDPYAIQNNQHLRDAVGMLRKLGVLKGGKDGGTLLIDQPFTARQVVNSTGNFFKDPKGTLGFGFEGPLPSPDRVPPIPNAYRGRGYRKGLPPQYKGDGFWEDVGSVVKNVGKKAAKAISNEVVQYAGPAAGAAFAAAATASGNPEFAPAAAILGAELGSKAGRYANSRIQGMGRKRRGGTLLIDQPFTARQVVNSTGNFFKDPKGTLGFGGTLLIDEPITARQVVNSTGNFFKNPGKTLGFGAKRGRPRKGKGFVEDIANFGNKLKPALDILRPSYMDVPELAQLGDTVARSVGLGVKKGKGPKGLKKFNKWTKAIGDFLKPVAKPILGALTDKAVEQIGNYGGAAKKPKRVMSEAQKAALAKGRAALRIKLNEMGAGVKKRKGKSGMALQPAGY